MRARGAAGAVCFAALALLQLWLPARADARSRRCHPVITSAQTKKIFAMLTVPPVALPEGFVLTGLQAERRHLRATYRSRRLGATVVIKLSPPPRQRHAPGTAPANQLPANQLPANQLPANQLTTSRFHLAASPRAGAPPTAIVRSLLEAVARRLRAREKVFDWACAEKQQDEISPVGSSSELGRERRRLLHALGMAWIVGILLFLVVLVIVKRRRQQPPPTTKGTGWRLDRFDVAVLISIAVYLALLVVPMSSLPITSDEVANLEPAVWSHWITSTNVQYPPLQRWLLNWNPTAYDPLWLIRLPAFLPAGWALWLFFRLARARAPIAVALGALALLALSVPFIDSAITNGPYSLWLPLILMASQSFSRALRGEPGGWVAYALWTFLACQTHFITVLWAASQTAYVLLRRRDQLRGLCLALAPAALSLAPLAYPLVLQDSAKLSGYIATSASAMLHVSLSALRPLTACTSLALLAVLINPRPEPKDPGLGLSLLFFFGLSLLFGLKFPLALRHVFPFCVLCLLLLIGHGGGLSARGKLAAQIVFVFAFLMAAEKARELIHRRWQELHRPSLYAHYLARRGDEPTPRAVLVWPPQLDARVVYGIAGTRRAQRDACLRIKRRGGGKAVSWPISATPHNVTPARLDRIIQRLGGFDLLVYGFEPPRLPQAARRWVVANCRVLWSDAALTKSGPKQVAYRCGEQHPPTKTLCKRVAALDRSARN